MSDDGITLEVFRVPHHMPEYDEGQDFTPVRFGHLTAGQAKILREVVDNSVSYDCSNVTAEPTIPKGRHRRTLGLGRATAPPVLDRSPSVGDTNPAAARDLGQLITDLTDAEPKPEKPSAVRFDVDLVYKYRQGDDEWTPTRTHQETLFAKDQEEALGIAGERLLRMLRRAGYVTHADHLQVTGGTTRAEA